MVKTYVGQKIIHLESVDSTNNYTANLLKDGKISSGAVILSDIQTEGRGQRSNTWQSLPFENLTFSFLLKPSNLRNISPITINHCVSLALAEFIVELGLKPQLKWPNDIYVNNQKIAGILIENNFNSGIVTNSITGIGVNINQTSFDSLNATSLALLKDEKYPIKGILFDIIFQLNKQFHLFETTSSEAVKERYDKNLWRINEIVRFNIANTHKQGVVLGTNTDGSLLVQFEDEILSFRNGEISFDLLNG
jgi:BirA family transcriptional regulator, biotin operon repressor / biotin---[acetyl-CoA-carboxylase] ligase